MPHGGIAEVLGIGLLSGDAECVQGGQTPFLGESMPLRGEISTEVRWCTICTAVSSPSAQHTPCMLETSLESSMPILAPGPLRALCVEEGREQREGGPTRLGFPRDIF